MTSDTDLASHETKFISKARKPDVQNYQHFTRISRQKNTKSSKKVCFPRSKIMNNFLPRKQNHKKFAFKANKINTTTHNCHSYKKIPHFAQSKIMVRVLYKNRLSTDYVLIVVYS